MDSFDEHIKTRLKQYKAHCIDKSNWNSFERYRYLHSDKKHHKDFSPDITQSIQNHTVPFKMEHWQQMEKQIALVEIRKRYIYFSKLVELTICALIFMIIIQYPDILIKQSDPDPLPKPNIEKAKESDIVYQHKNTSFHEIKPIQDKNIHTFKAQKTTIPFAQTGHNNLSISKLPAKDTYLKLAVVNQELDFFEPPITENRSLQSHEMDLDISTISLDGNQTWQDFTDKSEFKTDPITIPTHINEAIYSENVLIMPENRLATTPNPSVILSVYGAADANLINTPFDKVYSKASYYKEAINSSYGIGLAKQLQNLEIGLGLAYAKRKYNPETIEEIYGIRENLYSQVTFNRISFDIVSVPLQLHYRFIDKPTWRAYIMLSTTANFVVNADYGIKDVIVMGRPALDNNRSNTESRLEEKPFIKGLFHGDKIVDDYFISAGFGFSIEKDIFKHTSFYLQPSYQRQILSKNIGIGPNKDKIHTSSIQVGLKFKLI